jgi:hypothetical protein
VDVPENTGWYLAEAVAGVPAAEATTFASISIIQVPGGRTIAQLTDVEYVAEFVAEFSVVIRVLSKILVVDLKSAIAYS